MMFWELENPASLKKYLLNSETVLAVIETATGGAAAVSLAGHVLDLPVTYAELREVLTAEDEEDEAQHAN